MPAGGKCSVYVKEKEGISVTAEQEIQQLECAVCCTWCAFSKRILFVMSWKCLEKGLCLSWVDL